MSNLVDGQDAAFAENLAGYTGTVLGYYGGPRAYNIWSRSQWDQFLGNFKIPIWVGGFGGKPEGVQAVGLLRTLGVPKGCVTLLDMEARVDKTYVTHFGEVLQGSGYKVWVYGSTSTLFLNPQLNGYAPSNPTGVRSLYPHAGVRMTQWAFGAATDQDVIRKWVYTADTIWR